MTSYFSRGKLQVAVTADAANKMVLRCTPFIIEQFSRQLIMEE